MIIIAFSDKTSKFLPRVLCRGLKHTAPIGVHQDKLIMYQFISKNTIKQICLNMRDLQILQQHGWRFIYLTGDLPFKFYNKNVKTCCCSICKSRIFKHICLIVFLLIN